MAYRIFISHSSNDREWVEEIRRQITAVGIEVYIYEHDVQLGTSISEKLQSAIRRSHAVVAVLTRKGAASAYVQQELGFANSEGKLIIPLIQKGTPKKSLALLGDIEYLSFDPEEREAAVAELTSFLNKKNVSLQRKQDDLVLALVATALIVLIATS